MQHEAKRQSDRRDADSIGGETASTVRGEEREEEREEKRNRNLRGEE